MMDKKTIKPLYWVTFILLVWLALSYSINTAQYGDNFEQFDWAHGVEISYWKHPPITTWLLAGLNALIGVHPFNTFVLCFFCLAITVFFYRRLAGLMLSQKAADFSLMLLATSFMFTWRAQLYNHNLTLVMMTVVTVWYFFSRVQKESVPNGEWLVLGALAAIAVLSKYQSVIALLGLLVAFFLMRKRLGRQDLLGLCLAFLSFSILIAPHVVWFYFNYALISKYTFHFFSFSRPWLENLHMLVGFLLQQIHFFLTPLLICLVMLMLSRDVSKQGHLEAEHAPIRRIFLLTQVLLPLTFVVLLNQAAGMILANHWGFSVFIFLPILLASQLEWRLNAIKINLLKIFMIFQLMSIAVFMGMKLHAKHSIMRNHYDEFFPAQMMSDIVVSTWARETHCPLIYIDGPPFEGGIVSVYSGQYPAVLEGGESPKSPWINLHEMKQHGYILMERQPEALRRYGQVYTLPSSLKEKYQPLRDFYWVNVKPLERCHG